MQLSGWTRILIVLSGIWIASVVALVEVDRRRVLDDERPWGLVTLRDNKTSETYGGLRKSEIRRLGELTLKKSKSADAEPADTDEAKRLIEADPEPALAGARIAAWMLVPVAILWVLYGCLLWVRAGFARAMREQQMPIGQGRKLRPNPSLKRSANGRPPGPVWRYAVHFRQPGPGVLPSSPA